MHDAAHSRVTTNKKLNDIIGECFLAWPLTITLFGYRKTHAAHHRHLNTENDPDWTQEIQRPEFQFPKSLPQIIWIAIKYCVGFYAIKEMTNVSGYNERVPLHINLPRFFLYLTVVAASIYFDFWLQLILYWIAPLNVNFHIEHHIYTGVPFYNLPKLQAILSDIPAYRENAHITYGFLRGLLSECQGKPRTNPNGTSIVT